MSDTKARRTLLAGAVGAALLLLAGCGGSAHGASHADQTHDKANGGATVDVSDYLPHEGLRELSKASNLVVLGRVVRIESGVQIGQDAGMGYTVYTLEVEESSIVVDRRVLHDYAATFS